MVTLQLVSTDQHFNEIHDEALSVAKNIKDDYLKLFEVLLKVEARRIYEQFEIPSLYLYCVELLELSPQVTKDFTCVVRKSFDVPALASAVRSGKLTISKARKICPVLEGCNSKEWIELAESCSCRTVERAVAMANPKAAVGESMRPVGIDALEFKLGVSEEWNALLEKTKNLLSQKYKRAVSSEEALYILMSEYCEKNDPVVKAERVQMKSAASLVAAHDKTERHDGNSDGDSGSTFSEIYRTRYIPAAVKQSVNLRDKGQCTFVDRKGKRCNSKRWLEIHHIREFSTGGEHSLENLETLCTAHHKIKHMVSRDTKETSQRSFSRIAEHHSRFSGERFSK